MSNVRIILSIAIAGCLVSEQYAAALSPPSQLAAPPAGGTTGGPRRYPVPGHMLYDVLTPDGNYDRAALCEMEAECLGQAAGDCPRFPPGRALDAAERAELGACLHLADHCPELVSCLQLDPTEAELFRAPIRPDGTLDVPALCRQQAACTGEPMAECVEYLRDNPARPLEIAEMKRCYSTSTNCENLRHCFGLRGSETKPKPYISKRRLSEMKSELGRYAADYCACSDKVCRDDTMSRLDADLLVRLRPFADTPGDLEALPPVVRKIVRPVISEVMRCAKGGSRP